MLSENTADPNQLMPWDYLEPLPENDDPVLHGITAESIRAVVDFLTPSDPLRPGSWESAKWKLLALSHAMIHRTQQHSFTALAEKAGTSRAVLSHHSVKLVDQVGFAHHTGKSQGARQAYAERQKAVWRDRRGAGGESATEPAQAAHGASSTQETACHG
jgi:hypothetical protein